jgi:hypothetical protein
MLGAWQELSLAHMVAGGFTGADDPDQTLELVNENIPPSNAFPGAGYSIFYLGGNPGGPYFNTNYEHVIFFGMQADLKTTNWTTMAGYPVLSTQQASNIDRKVDDGMPGSGRVLGTVNGAQYSPNCATAAATPAYDLTKTGPQCSMVFITGF